MTTTPQEIPTFSAHEMEEKYSTIPPRRFNPSVPSEDETRGEEKTPASVNTMDDNEVVEALRTMVNNKAQVDLAAHAGDKEYQRNMEADLKEFNQDPVGYMKKVLPPLAAGEQPSLIKKCTIPCIMKFLEPTFDDSTIDTVGVDAGAMLLMLTVMFRQVCAVRWCSFVPLYRHGLIEPLPDMDRGQLFRAICSAKPPRRYRRHRGLKIPGDGMPRKSSRRAKMKRRSSREALLDGCVPVSGRERAESAVVPRDKFSVYSEEAFRVAPVRNSHLRASFELATIKEEEVADLPEWMSIDSRTCEDLADCIEAEEAASIAWSVYNPDHDFTIGRFFTEASIVKVALCSAIDLLDRVPSQRLVRSPLITLDQKLRQTIELDGSLSYETLLRENNVTKWEMESAKFNDKCRVFVAEFVSKYIQRAFYLLQGFRYYLLSCQHAYRAASALRYATVAVQDIGYLLIEDVQKETPIITATRSIFLSHNVSECFQVPSVIINTAHQFIHALGICANAHPRIGAIEVTGGSDVYYARGVVRIEVRTQPSAQLPKPYTLKVWVDQFYPEVTRLKNYVRITAAFFDEDSNSRLFDDTQTIFVCQPAKVERVCEYIVLWLTKITKLCHDRPEVEPLRREVALRYFVETSRRCDEYDVVTTKLVNNYVRKVLKIDDDVKTDNASAPEPSGVKPGTEAAVTATGESAGIGAKRKAVSFHEDEPALV